MGTVRFARFTAEEKSAVVQVVRRARAAKLLERIGCTASDLEMCIAAVHAHTPLELGELAKAPVVDFTTDVAGIFAHTSRLTGRLEGRWRPRHAMKGRPVKMVRCVYKSWIPVGRARTRCPGCGAVMGGSDHPVQLRGGEAR